MIPAHPLHIAFGKNSELEAGRRYLYLIPDESKLFELKRLYPAVSIEPAGRAFHELLEKHKKDFLDYFQEQMKENSDRASLHETQFFSRYVLGNPFIRCVLDLLVLSRRIQTSPDEKWGVIVDHAGLAHAITENFNISEVGRKSVLKHYRLQKALMLLKWVKRALTFSFSSLNHYLVFLLNQTALLVDVPKDVHLIRTWVTRGGLDPFIDRCFGVFSEALHERSVNVFTQPMFFNLGESPISAMLKLKKSETRSNSPTKTQWLFQEQFLKPQDYVLTFFRGLGDLRVKFSQQKIFGLQVASLAKFCYRSDVLSPDILNHRLFHRFTYRLKAAGHAIRAFFYPFENNAVEKTMIRAVKNEFPSAMTVGFQHSVWYRENLGQILDGRELSTHPMPDLIFTKGRKYPKILEAAGFPKDRILEGCNLRFQNLPKFSKQERGRARLGVIFTFQETLAYSMLRAISEVREKWNREQPLEIEIKLHPLNRRARVEGWLDELKIPRTCISSGSVADVLSRSSVALMYSSSVSSLEALLSGTPLIQWELSNDFDLDCVWEENLPSFVKVNSAGSLQTAIENALKIDASERERVSNSIREDYFEPVSKAALDRMFSAVFMEKLSF